MRIILLGPPGSGKGTQALRLAISLAVPHISTGDILRSEIETGSERGRFIKSRIDHGEFVPDEFISEIVVGRLDWDDAQIGFILDGFPRTLPQTGPLLDYLEKKGLGIDAVIALDVPEDILKARLSARDGGRPDDAEEAIPLRLAIYADRTLPISAFYEAMGILHHVDGTKAPHEVEVEILDILAKKAK